MEKTAILLSFETCTADEEKRIVDNILQAFAEEDVTPHLSSQEYDDKYGGPVIYFP